MTDKTLENPNILYEDKNFAEITDCIMRPGGLELTKTIMQKSNLPPKAKILDIGCGYGKTVQYLQTQLGYTAFGIDQSDKLINQGLAMDANLNLQTGAAENLPFADQSFDAVIGECVFCLLPDKPKALQEIYRILKPNGKLILSDLYLQEPSSEPISFFALTCLQNLLMEAEIQNLLAAEGFKNKIWLDCKEEYISFLAQLMFSFDSIESFQKYILGSETNQNTASQMLKNKKISYYSAIWKKL